MHTHNPENERIKRAYFAYLKEARRLGSTRLMLLRPHSIYLKLTPTAARLKPFTFSRPSPSNASWSMRWTKRTGEPLSKSTLLTTLHALRAFFQWLSLQPGYRSRLSYADAEYFNLSEKDTRIAKAVTEKRVPQFRRSCV